MTVDPSSPRQTLANRLMTILWRKPATDIGEQTRRRVVVHIIPILFCLYILAYLDRANLSVAWLGMKKPSSEGGLGSPTANITDADWVLGVATGMFFWGYWILEIPSTVSVLRWGARWVFARILILWGLSCTMIGFIGLPVNERLFGWLPSYFHDDPAIVQLYFLRFMLGFFEGGFFPSVIVYLTLWFRPKDRAKAIATFMAAIPVSLMLGTPLSGAMLALDWGGLPGWRWVFIIQGLIPVLAGVVVLFLLPDRPQTARWLPRKEAKWLQGELDKEAEVKQGHGHWASGAQILSVLLLTAYYFCMNVTSYGLSQFLPSIIQRQTGWSSLWVTVVCGAAYLLALGAMLTNGWHSDKTGERIRHVAVPLVCLSGGIFLTALTDGAWLWPVLVMIFLVGPFMYAHLPAFWPIPSTFLGATAAASAIGFINMIGNLGGSVGPMIVGKAATAETFAPSLLLLAPFPLFAATIILIVGYSRRKALSQAT